MTGFSAVLIGSFQKVYSEISEWTEGVEVMLSESGFTGLKDLWDKRWVLMASLRYR